MRGVAGRHGGGDRPGHRGIGHGGGPDDAGGGTRLAPHSGACPLGVQEVRVRNRDCNRDPGADQPLDEPPPIDPAVEVRVYKLLLRHGPSRLDEW